MPPRSLSATRRVKLPRNLFSSHPLSGLSSGTTTQSSSQLLQYSVAFNQPNATVPLLATGRSPTHTDHDGLMSSGFHSETALAARRWVRDADELCVDSMRRSDNIHRINTYVATYKLHDPQWQPLLLPEVHVLRRRREHQRNEMKMSSSRDNNNNDNNSNNNNNEESASSSDAGDAKRQRTPVPQGPLSSSSSPPTPPSSSNTFGVKPDGGRDHEVYINYNKLVSLELMSRHANFALKHLVQRGHAMYFITVSQHSILAMRGLVEASYVTCAYGVRGERLRTYLKHIGPLDVRDVLSIDSKTGRVQFDWNRPNVRRGVVATSLVEGYGTWFQRKPMLWQRSRRIGALQAQLGAHQYVLPTPESVGRVRDCEISLLEPHISFHGGGEAGGGATAVGVIASTQVAQNPKLFMGQFEAPVIAALDSVHQLAHRSALHHRLIRPADAAGGGHDSSAEWRQRVGQEAMLPVSWTTRTPPPYVPLEADLPFKLQLSRPAVFFDTKPSQVAMAAATGAVGGSTIGTPFVRGVPITFMEFLLHQGVDHYVFDDAPSARPMKWWNQKSNMPYNGHMYFMRSGLLDTVEPTEEMENPLAPRSHRTAPRSPSGSSSSPSTTKGGKARRRRLALLQRRKKQQQQKAAAAAAALAEADALQPGAPEPGASTTTTEVTRMPTRVEGAEEPTLAEEEDVELNLAPETLSADGTSIDGHDDVALAEDLAALEADAPPPREPFHRLVPPNDIAERRARRYFRAAVRDGKAVKAAVSATAGGGVVEPRSPDSSEGGPDGAMGGVVVQRKRLRKRGNRRLLQKHSRSDEGCESG